MAIIKVHAKTVYWHLLPNIPLKDGQHVRAGDIIGFADSTGLSTGDHLHFGLKPQAKNEQDSAWYNVAQNNGYKGAIDPSLYFNNYYAQDAQKVIPILQSLIVLYTKVISKLRK